MDKYEIRRRNFATLIESRFGGKKAKMAEAIGMSASYVSRMLYTEDKPAKKRIGEDTVDLLETTFSLPKGSLDRADFGVPHSAEVPRTDSDLPFIDSPMANAGMGVRVGSGPATMPIRAVKLRLQAGVSGFMAEPDMNIDHGYFDVPITVIEELRLNPADLLVMAIKGRSMEPMMFEDDKVLVDTSKRMPLNNECFALNWNGEPIVKCLIKKGDSWALYSMNRDPKYHTIDVRSGQCSIIGLVVWQPARIVTGRI